MSDPESRVPYEALNFSLKCAQEFFDELIFLRERYKESLKNMPLKSEEDRREHYRATVLMRACKHALVMEIGRLFDPLRSKKRDKMVISLKKLDFSGYPYVKKEIDEIHGEAIIAKIIKTRNTWVAHMGKAVDDIISVDEICDSKLGILLDRLKKTDLNLTLVDSDVHDAIDFTVAAYIVHAGKVLLVDHRQLNKWLPVGGHIELDEDPEQALFKEIWEETGLGESDIEVVGTKPDQISDTTKFLYPPQYLDIHRISQTHRHIGMVYFIRARTDKVRLAEEEHRAIRWFTQEELDTKEVVLMPEVEWYARQALMRIDKNPQTC